MKTIREAYSLFRIYLALNKNPITAINLTIENLRTTK